MWFRVIAVVFCLFAYGFCQSKESTEGSVVNPGEDEMSTPKTQVEEEDYDDYEVNEDSLTEREKNERLFFFKKKRRDDKVCFKTLGCFTMADPWKSVLRPISAPMSPKKIAAFIRFFNRNNLENEVNITLYPELDMNGAEFDPEKLTVFIVHGFATSGTAEWLDEMKDAYLKNVDANVMVVDWGRGAQLFNYLQVAGNTRLVGRQLENFVKTLIRDYNADPKNFHLIGHSLGAHICSYLAKGVPGISRLTALDPASPGFEGFDRTVRLADTDADFIDVIHTDAKPFIPTLGFGMTTPVGHVDFYMNGGFSQPGCLIPNLTEIGSITSLSDLALIPVEMLAKIPLCPHGRAYQYFTEALNDTDCVFWGHKANPLNVIQSATNTVTQGLLKNTLKLYGNCTVETCVPLGLNSPSSSLRGVFLVTTAGKEPYCLRGKKKFEDEDDEPKKESVFQKIKKMSPLFFFNPTFN